MFTWSDFFLFPCLRQTYVQPNTCASDDVQTTQGATCGDCITPSSTNLWQTTNSCAYVISQPHLMTSYSYVSNDGYVTGVSEHLTAICKNGHDIRSRTSDSLFYAQSKGGGVWLQQRVDTLFESHKHSLKEATEFKMDPYSRGVNKLARSDILNMVTMSIDVLWNKWIFIYRHDEGTGFIWNVRTLFSTTRFKWKYRHYQTVLSYYFYCFTVHFFHLVLSPTYALIYII